MVCAQNGVENERLALRHLLGRLRRVRDVAGRPSAAGGGAGLVGAHARHPRHRCRTGKGRADKAEALASSSVRAGFSSHAVTDIMRWKYAKLVMNLGNAVEAMCGPEARVSEISVLARREGIGGARGRRHRVRSGRGFRGPPGQPDHPQGLRWRPTARRRFIVAEPGPGHGAIEADYLNGEIGLLGRLHGDPTPVNSMSATRSQPDGRRRDARRGRAPGR